MAGNGGGGGVARQAVQQTAGKLSGVSALLNPLGAKTTPASPLGGLVGVGPPSGGGSFNPSIAAVLNPLPSGNPAPLPLSAGAFAAALNSPVGGGPSGAEAAAGGAVDGPPLSQAPQPTLNDYINAILGQSAPTAPTAADFGAAPTLADFFSSAPYQQALAAVAAGGKTATGSINGAYGQAGTDLSQLQGISNTQQGAYNRQLAGDQANTNSQMAAILANAAKLGGGQSVVSSLAPMQATLKGNMEGQSALNNTLNALQTQGNNAFSQGLALNHQGSLNALASAISGENGRINQAQAADQARGQQELAAANSSRGAAMAKANTDYQNSLGSYNSQRAAVLRDAETQAEAKAPTNRQAALNTLAGWQASGNQNGDALFSVANGIINGTKNSSGQPIPAARDEAGAMNYLDQMANNPANGFGKNSIMYNILAGMLQQYYSPGKTSPDLLGTLKSMAGG